MFLSLYQRYPTSRPSEYWTVVPLPGNWAVVDAGTWDRSCGNVTGRWPPGSVWPNSTLASAVPLPCPGDPASRTDATWFSHGIAIGAPALTTTTVCGLAAATASMSSSCADGRLRFGRSVASDSVSSETTTTAVCAVLAALTAAVMPGASADGVSQSSWDESPLIERVYLVPAVRFTATEYVFTGGVLGLSSMCVPFRLR